MLLQGRAARPPTSPHPSLAGNKLRLQQQQHSAGSRQHRPAQMALARAAASVARALQPQSGRALGSSLGANVQAARGMGGAAHHGNPNDYVTYAGLSIKKVAGWEYGLSKAIGATMWFWIFYMGYHEWDHKTKGLPALFEAEGLDDDGHGHH